MIITFADILVVSIALVLIIGAICLIDGLNTSKNICINNGYEYNSGLVNSINPPKYIKCCRNVPNIEKTNIIRECKVFKYE